VRPLDLWREPTAADVRPTDLPAGAVHLGRYRARRALAFLELAVERTDPDTPAEEVGVRLATVELRRVAHPATSHTLGSAPTPPSGGTP
jgi:hypothetical protein